ncbi:MAG: helix-turn-helix domain-containing protein [Propionibacteriaceae bacterium]
MRAASAAESRDDGLGRRLRALRKGRGRSIQQVADAAHVSKSFISHLELGRSSASLGTLKRICAALDAPVWTLLDDPDESEVVEGQVAIVRGDERKFRRVAGTEIDIALLSPDLNRDFQVTMSVLKPGEGYGSETYTHQAEEFGLVLQGAYEVTVDGTVHLLQVGDSIYFDSRLPHRTRAVGEGDTVTFWVTTPPS